MSNFDRAFRFLIGEEGGYSADPHDPGGETKFGISKRAYPQLDIKSLTLDQAKAIYRRDYWDRLQLDARKYGPALVLFDCAINQGVARAQALVPRIALGSALLSIALTFWTLLHRYYLP